MANRTVTWLLNKGWLVAKNNNNSVAGERLVALTKAGVATLRYTLPGDRAHARDWLRHAHAHRTAANSAFVAIAHSRQLGGTGYDDPCSATELEISAGDYPAGFGIFRYSHDGVEMQKIPDGILYIGNKHVWLEVENAWRGAKDFEKLLSFLRATFNQRTPPAVEVWFVITASGAKTIGKRLKARLGPRTDGIADGRSLRWQEFDAKLLSDRIKIFSLDADTLELTPVPV